MHSDKSSRSGAHVLVVDDDSDTRQAMSELLGDYGFRVETTSDGEEALRALGEDPPDLIISDIRMPRLGGIELARRLREKALTQSIPMILISGFDDPSARIEGLEIGADDFISKPVDPAELVARIRVHLRHADRYKRLLRESLIDDLTGILNRRGIISALERELAAAARDRPPPSIVLADVDRFKEINDRLGHVAGDRALQDVARILGQRIRSGDELGRLGGDEFLIVAPATSGAACAALIRRLENGLPMSGADGQTVVLDLSLGGATARPDETVDDLINRADLAMYRKKRSTKEPGKRLGPAARKTPRND